MSDFNPYDAPSAPLPTGKYVGDQGMRREGKLLLMSKGAEFPDRCVKCNAPAEGYRLKRDLSWHSPGYYVLIFFLCPGLLTYIIVAMIVRKTARAWVPLCPRHRSARLRDIAIGWLGALAGIAMMFGAATAPGDYGPMMVTGGLVVFLVALLYGVLRAQAVVPSKIDKTMVWLRSISPDFLAMLPDASAHAQSAWLEPARPKEDTLEIIDDFHEV
jgi:hypothetical protein